MDISQIPAKIKREDTPATVLLHGPGGEPDIASDGTRASIDIVGVYSKHYQECARKFRTEHAETATEMTEAESNAEVVAWAVVGWHGIEDNGSPLELTDANIRNVFALAPWVTDKVRVGLNNRDALFTAASVG